MSLPCPVAEAAPPDGREAIVVFIDSPATRWLKVLRPGFRHCFAALRQDATTWLVCDPLKDRIELCALHLPDDFDLAAHYRDAGHLVLAGTTIVTPARRPPPPALLTCVAVVKRLIGLRRVSVVTPFALYRDLMHLGWRPSDDVACLGAESLDRPIIKEY